MELEVFRQREIERQKLAEKKVKEMKEKYLIESSHQDNSEIPMPPSISLASQHQEEEKPPSLPPIQDHELPG